MKCIFKYSEMYAYFSYMCVFAYSYIERKGRQGRKETETETGRGERSQMGQNVSR